MSQPQYAIGLNGTGSQYAIRGSDDTSMDFAGDFTIAFWFRPVQTYDYQIIMEKYNPSNGNGWSIYYRANNKIEFYAHNLASSLSTFTGSVNPLACQYLFCVLTRTGNTTSWYVNNVVQNTTSTVFAFDTPNKPLLIGKRDPADVAGPYGVWGSLDEVSIWSRYLSSAERDALYNLGFAAPVSVISTTGIIAAYSFEQNGNDYSGNGRNLTVNGSPNYVPGKSLTVLRCPQNWARSYNGGTPSQIHRYSAGRFANLKNTTVRGMTQAPKPPLPKNINGGLN